jgi:hypothetical protein
VSEASVKQGSHLDEAVDDGEGVELCFPGGVFVDNVMAIRS